MASSATNATPSLRPLKPHLGVAIAPSPLLLAQPWFLGLLALPAAAWSALAAWQEARRRLGANPEARRRADLERRVESGLRALARLAEQPDPEPFFAALFRLLQDMVALPLGNPPASITEGVVDSELPKRGVPTGTIEALHRLFQACNQARYGRGGSPGDRAELGREAANVWSDLRTRK